MTKPKSASSVMLGNRIQTAIAQAVQQQGQITSALVVMFDKNIDDIHSVHIVSEDDLTDIILMYPDKTK
jgi:hypothetical protein